MSQTLHPFTGLQVTDLVLDPFYYSDALAASARRDQLEPRAVDRLAAVLPLAIAQLDAVGDQYGALALAGIFDRLIGPLATV